MKAWAITWEPRAGGSDVVAADYDPALVRSARGYPTPEAAIEAAVAGYLAQAAESLRRAESLQAMEEAQRVEALKRRRVR